jgi:hypothetical protein
MTNLVLKYNLLNPVARKEALDFMDFLLVRDSKPTKLSTAAYKKKILKVSVWDDSDIEVIQSQQNRVR